MNGIIGRGDRSLEMGCPEQPRSGPTSATSQHPEAHRAQALGQVECSSYRTMSSLLKCKHMEMSLKAGCSNCINSLLIPDVADRAREKGSSTPPAAAHHPDFSSHNTHSVVFVTGLLNTCSICPDSGAD